MGVLYLSREGLSRALVENRLPQGSSFDFGNLFVPIEGDGEKRNALLVLEVEASADPESAIGVVVLDVLAGDAVDIGEGQIGEAVVVAHAPIIHRKARNARPKSEKRRKIKKVVNPCQ
jgi:hypothetical protein